MKSSDSTHISTQSSLPSPSCRLGLQVLILLAMMFLAGEASAQNYVFERLWPQLPQPWYFWQPNSVAVDASGNVFVADSDNYRIQVFDSSGTFLAKWGWLGSGNGEFWSPVDVAVDTYGRVYVADGGNSRIQRFIKASGLPDTPGAATLLSPSGNIIASNPTYDWNAVPLASWYRLWVNDASAAPKIQQWCTADQAGCDSKTGICKITPSVALTAGACQWWIQAWNSAG